jgi:alcohol oxidase
MTPTATTGRSRSPTAARSQHSRMTSSALRIPSASPSVVSEQVDLASHRRLRALADDIQDCKTANASEIWAKYINRHTGRRSDAATAYVHSVMDVQTNLFLRTNARVSRVVFEGTKAVGVAYVPSRNRAHGGQVRETVVRASKCVVISSGTLGTPQILERSGVGSKDLLKKLDIKLVSDLPGVGEEYQDHYTTLSSTSCLLISMARFDLAMQSSA